MRYGVNMVVTAVYGNTAAKSIMRFADQYASKNMSSFADIFKKIAESAKRENKFAWAESQDKDKQIKGNIAGVIGSQFKPLKDKDKLMPQSTSMNMANTIDALCDAKASQEEIQKFLDCWKKVASPQKEWDAESTVDFANNIQSLRKRLEQYIQDQGDTPQTEQAKRLQAQLCYVEAGIYGVSEIEFKDNRYEIGPRQDQVRQNVIQQGFFDADQPPKEGDSGKKTKVREMQHDILISGLFNFEESLFSQLDLKPLAAVRRVGYKNINELIDQGGLTKKEGEQELFINACREANSKLANDKLDGLTNQAKVDSHHENRKDAQDASVLTAELEAKKSEKRMQGGKDWIQDKAASTKAAPASTDKRASQSPKEKSQAKIKKKRPILDKLQKLIKQLSSQIVPTKSTQARQAKNGQGNAWSLRVLLSYIQAMLTKKVQQNDQPAAKKDSVVQKVDELSEKIATLSARLYSAQRAAISREVGDEIQKAYDELNACLDKIGEVLQKRDNLDDKTLNQIIGINQGAKRILGMLKKMAYGNEEGAKNPDMRVDTLDSLEDKLKGLRDKAKDHYRHMIMHVGSQKIRADKHSDVKACQSWMLNEMPLVYKDKQYQGLEPCNDIIVLKAFYEHVASEKGQSLSN